MILEERDGSTILEVIVQPKSSRAAIVGVHGGALKLRVTSPPEKGAANRQCIEILSEALGLSKRDIELIQGSSSRRKRFRIAAPVEKVRKALEEVL